jgi:hypothetical protein
VYRRVVHIAVAEPAIEPSGLKRTDACQVKS